MKEVSNKLGSLTEIFGYIITYSFLFLVLLFFYKTNENISLEEVSFISILILILFIGIFYFGRIFYTFYKSYLNLIKNKKSLNSFKFHWYMSLLFLIIIWISLLFLLLSWLITDYYKMNALIFPLIYLPLLIPQTILQYKTFRAIKIPLSINPKALKINRMININKLEKNEIIIVSLIIGVILSLSFGYMFCISHYYKWSKGNLIEVYYKTKQENCTFNYAIAIGTFISIGGLTYLFLNRKNGDTR